jgi:hypothetical protein
MTEAQERQPDLVELREKLERATAPENADPRCVKCSRKRSDHNFFGGYGYLCHNGSNTYRAPAALYLDTDECAQLLAALDEAARMRERVSALGAALRNIEGEELSSVCRALARASLSSPVKES